MRFRILGPLEVQIADGWIPIGAAKWRAVLARLLLSEGQIVSTDTLIHELWGDAPPARAPNLVSIYVLRLRRFIGDHEGRVLKTRSPGYQLELGQDDLDTQRFGILMSHGREALTAGDPRRAAGVLADSLALWRGKALADIPLSTFIEAEAERLDELRLAAALDTLFDAHLLESPSPRRYQFHDLLRVYAAERAEADEPEPERIAALRWLLSWYVHTADAAAQAVSPYRYQGLLDDPEPGCRPRSFRTADQALAWYDADRASLVAVTRQAASLRFDDAAWQLAASLYSVFYRRGNWPDCVATHRIALISARRTGSRLGEAWVLNNLGEALARRHMQEAISDLEESLAIRREIGDHRGEAQAANNLGNVYLELRRPREALDYLRRSLLLQRDGGYRYGEGIALHNLGEANLDLERFDEAIESLQQARAIFTELSDLNGEGWVLHSLGRAHRGLGRNNESVDCLRQALAVRRSIGDRCNQAFTLRLIGDVNESMGDTGSARDCWNQALAIFGELGDETQSAELTEILELPRKQSQVAR